MTTDQCRHHQAHHKSTSSTSLSNTLRNVISNNLILMTGVAIALFTSAGSSPVDPNTLEQVIGSYTNRGDVMGDREALYGGGSQRRKRMGEGSGFVRFGKRSLSPAAPLPSSDYELTSINQDDLEKVSLDQEPFERGVRAESGFVRFGKRKIPGGLASFGKRKIPGGFANKVAGKRMSDHIPEEAVEEPFEVSKRASSSGFVRFGKRMPGSDMRFGKRDSPGGMKVGTSYSDCVAKTVAQAVNRTDLLNLLIANGCIRGRLPLQQNYVQVKKDESFVRFG